MRNNIIFAKYLKKYPLSHALARGIESLWFSEVKLKKPVLDLGCGDGSFSLLTFSQKDIDTGIDKDFREIAKAKKTGVYRRALIADAQELPFKNGEFNTIIANSFLEHVNDPGKVIKECNRVLAKGGKLIFSTPSKGEQKYWFWAKIFGRSYLRFVDKLMGHNAFGDKEYWIKKLKLSGFSKISFSGYAPKKTVTLLDFFRPFGIAYLIFGKVFGPRKILVKMFSRFFYLDKKGGLGYFFVAVK